MAISVRGYGMHVSRKIRRLVDRRVSFELSRFGRQVRAVTVNLEDLNGPRGGIDKRCSMQADLAPGAGCGWRRRTASFARPSAARRRGSPARSPARWSAAARRRTARSGNGVSARAPDGPGGRVAHAPGRRRSRAARARPRGGLSGEEARRRLREHGPNELAASRRTSPLRLLAAQFKNVLILILLVAVGLSAFLGHTLEAVVISVILLFAVLLGFVQEYRAERAIEGLRRMAAPVATALRDGDEQDVAARELVPGDVVRLEAGARVPADARVLEAVNLKVEEAALTGESLPVGKVSEPLAAADLAVGDRKNMVYAGTTVTYGRGSAVVVETGMRTEFGTIARLLQGVESRRTPLQENLDRVGRVLARAAVAVVAADPPSRHPQGPAVLGDGDLRDRPGRGGRPGSAAGGRDDLPRPRRAADGEAQRAGAPAVRPWKRWGASPSSPRTRPAR